MSDATNVARRGWQSVCCQASERAREQTIRERKIGRFEVVDADEWRALRSSRESSPAREPYLSSGEPVCLLARRRPVGHLDGRLLFALLICAAPGAAANLARRSIGQRLFALVCSAAVWPAPPADLRPLSARVSHIPPACDVTRGLIKGKTICSGTRVAAINARRRVLAPGQARLTFSQLAEIYKQRFTREGNVNQFPC